MRGLGCGCSSNKVLLRGLGDTSLPSEVAPDIVGAVAAFSAPFAYEKYAPKKWPRPGIFGTVVGVVGTYLLTRFVYNQIAA